MSSFAWNVQIPVYEGPLDLLLDLIRKQQLDIYDIPIAQVTQQYLDYLQRVAELDMELSAEFVYMAATLIHIKSRTLLPRDPELEKLDPEEDPRRELVDRLLEYERYKSAAAMLHEKRMIEEAVWSNPQLHKFDDQEEPGLAVTLFDLVKTLEAVLERVKNRPLYEVDQEDLSIPDMILYLKSRLKDLPKNVGVSVTQMFEQQRSRRAMVCLFLAILEMVKQQAVLLAQHESFGDITVKRHTYFDQVQASSEEIARIEEEYSN